MQRFATFTWRCSTAPQHSTFGQPGHALVDAAQISAGQPSPPWDDGTWDWAKMKGCSPCSEREACCVRTWFAARAPLCTTLPARAPSAVPGCANMDCSKPGAACTACKLGYRQVLRTSDYGGESVACEPVLREAWSAW